MKLPNLNPKDLCRVHDALAKGARLKAFLSGGGLRVLYLQKGDKKIGYGEHPYVHEAFRILAEDFAAGGRPYNEVYGKQEDLYLTGASTPEDDLDAWVRRGNKFSAEVLNGEVAFTLHGWHQMTLPESVFERCKAGEKVDWEDRRGVKYHSYPVRFANGEPGAGTSQVFVPEGITDAWLWEASALGTGPDLLEAMTKAFLEWERTKP